MCVQAWASSSKFGLRWQQPNRKRPHHLKSRHRFHAAPPPGALLPVIPQPPSPKTTAAPYPIRSSPKRSRLVCPANFSDQVTASALQNSPHSSNGFAQSGNSSPKAGELPSCFPPFSKAHTLPTPLHGTTTPPIPSPFCASSRQNLPAPGTIPPLPIFASIRVHSRFPSPLPQIRAISEINFPVLCLPGSGF